MHGFYLYNEVSIGEFYQHETRDDLFDGLVTFSYSEGDFCLTEPEDCWHQDASTQSFDCSN